MLAGRGARGAAPQPTFRTLRGGLGSLVEALKTSIEGAARVVHGEVEAIERAGGGYRLRIGGDWLAAERVALACESHAAAELARGLDPKLSDALGAIPYSSSTVIALGFDPASFASPPEGFGFLVPRRERKRLVACTFMGTKFPFRAAQNRILLRCFIAGAQEDATLVGSVLEELREMTPLTGEPLFTRVYRWPRSMAQYTVGHRERISTIEGRLKETLGFYLAGNAYSGIGIPDCVRMGRQVAERASKPNG
jgi:oxygen-dependent protoporphyrinogen oxidase